MRPEKCKCGADTHRYSNHPLCTLPKKERTKPKHCPSCGQDNHFRKTSKKCPNNHVFYVYHLSIIFNINFSKLFPFFSLAQFHAY